MIMVSVKLKESVGLNEFGRSGGRPLLVLGEWDFGSIDFWICIFRSQNNKYAFCRVTYMLGLYNVYQLNPLLSWN